MTHTQTQMQDRLTADLRHTRLRADALRRERGVFRSFLSPFCGKPSPHLIGILRDIDTEVQELSALASSARHAVETQLPEPMCRLILLLYEDGLTREQAAQQLYIDPQTAYRWQRKALGALSPWW